MHAPIHGSQINPPARLYKQFTATETARLDGKELIYENNRYRTFCSIRYTEATELQEGDDQPLRGLLIDLSHMTIKFNGKYRPQRRSPMEPESGDLLLIGDEYWIIEDGIQRVRHKTLRNMATVYLPLRKIL